MPRPRRFSDQTLAVLLSLTQEPAHWQHGYDLCKQTGLKAGSMYPILMRLADRGWLETSWESALSAGRPPRHLYRLTRTGLERARELIAIRAGETRTGQTRLLPSMEGSS